MKCETVRELFNDYADGLLMGREPEMVAGHLDTCAKCAREFAELQALLKEAKALPRVVEPRRDLWANIRGQIENEPPRREKRPHLLVLNNHKRVRPPFFAKTVATAAVLLAVLAGGLVLLQRPAPVNPDQAANEPPARLRQEVLAVQAEYERARGELVAAMDQLPHRLAPETRSVIDQNLAIIDGAIKEIQTSLEKDPENVFLFDMLVAEQDRSLRLLGLEEAITSKTW